MCQHWFTILKENCERIISIINIYETSIQILVIRCLGQNHELSPCFFLDTTVHVYPIECIYLYWKVLISFSLYQKAVWHLFLQVFNSAYLCINLLFSRAIPLLTAGQHICLIESSDINFAMSKKRAYPVQRAPVLCGVWGRVLVASLTLAYAMRGDRDSNPSTFQS